jgi:NADPH-dependent curcumin reductase CurA
LIRILHNNFRIKVQESPSCNCQLFSIAPFQRLVMKGFAYNPEIYPKLMEFITELSRICGAGKRLCQIDIKEQLYNGIKDHVNILSEMKYKNLTGTNMVGLIIKI